MERVQVSWTCQIRKGWRLTDEGEGGCWGRGSCSHFPEYSGGLGTVSQTLHLDNEVVSVLLGNLYESWRGKCCWMMEGPDLVPGELCVFVGDKPVGRVSRLSITS